MAHFNGDRAKLNAALLDTYGRNLDTMERERVAKQQQLQLRKAAARKTAAAAGKAAKGGGRGGKAQPSASALAAGLRGAGGGGAAGSQSSAVPTWVPGSGIKKTSALGKGGSSGSPPPLPVPTGPAALAATTNARAVGGVAGVGLKVAVRKPGAHGPTSAAATAALTAAVVGNKGVGSVSAMSLARQLHWVNGQVVQVDSAATIIQVSPGSTDSGRRIRVPHAHGAAAKYIRLLPAL